jgi:hypothetical protein
MPLWPNTSRLRTLATGRTRAEEARRRSEQIQDSITRALLLEIADTYERIAKAYEEQPSTYPHRDR